MPTQDEIKRRVEAAKAAANSVINSNDYSEGLIELSQPAISSNRTENPGQVADKYISEIPARKAFIKSRLAEIDGSMNSAGIIDKAKLAGEKAKLLMKYNILIVQKTILQYKVLLKVYEIQV